MFRLAMLTVLLALAGGAILGVSAVEAARQYLSTVGGM